MLKLSNLKPTLNKGLAVSVAALTLLSVNQISNAAMKKMATPEPQMKAVLDELAALKGKPIEKLTAKEARKQPGPTDAVKKLLTKKGRSTAPEDVEKVENKVIPGPAGKIPVRIYTPSTEENLPVIVYFHGGGWVIANIDAYDASCRALANNTNAIVVSVGYRQAPEHKFPAAPEDAFAATQWVMKNAGTMNGDPNKVAVAGESAGGNLATVVSLMSREKKGKMPVHQLLVYPVTDHNFNKPSYIENANAKPLNKAMMPWFWNNYLKSPTEATNQYAVPLKAKSLKGLPPTTIIAAEIDPLRSEGQEYANRLKQAGVPVTYKLYTGVAHEFFGMGAVVDKAKDAISFASAELNKSFNK